VARCCEHGNEASGSLKGSKFCDLPKNCCFLKNEPVSQSWKVPYFICHLYFAKNGAEIVKCSYQTAGSLAGI